MMASMAFVGPTGGFAVARDDALIGLFRSEYQSLVRLACLLLDDRGAGEEVAQEAFVRLHGAWARLRDSAAAPAYLRTTVVNLSRSRMRRRQVADRQRSRQRFHAASASAEEEAMLLPEHSRVLAAMRALPRRQRECLALRFCLDLSEADTAATLHIAVGSVKSHTHRGLATLARTLEYDDE
jgi:RNA polymerase sigma-70 factor (sigma-E family)